jgi:hypothetical protein
LDQHEHDLKIGAQSTTRHEIIWVGIAWPEGGPELGLKFWPVRASGMARIDGSGLGRHGPIKANMFNFFNLVRY